MAAKTKEQVQKQSERERLWDELEVEYGQQTEESNKAYDQAFAQTGREMLKRGMQRTSYGAQTQANVLQQKNEAANKIGENKIAAYQKGVSAIEQREAEERYRQQQIAVQQAQVAAQQAALEEQRRQFNENLAYQREQAELNRQFQISEREATQGFTTSEREASQLYASGENALNRAQSQSQFDANLGYNYASLAQQKSLTEAQLEQAQRQYDANLAYNYANLAQQKALTEAQLAQNKELTQAQMAQNQSQFEANQAYNYASLAQQKDLTQAQMKQSQDQFTAQLNQSQSQFDANLQQNYAQMQQTKDLTLAQMAQSKELSQAELAQAKELTMAQLNQSAEQFNQEFGLKSKSAEQSIAMGVISTAASNGGDVSDDLLAMAGISRADYNAMKTGTAAAKSSGSPSGPPAWKKNGFNSAADYEAAQAGGFPDASTYNAAKAKGFSTYSGYQNYLNYTKNNNASDPLGLGGTITSSKNASNYKAINPDIAAHVESKIGNPNIANANNQKAEEMKKKLEEELKKATKTSVKAGQ